MHHLLLQRSQFRNCTASKKSVRFIPSHLITHNLEKKISNLKMASLNDLVPSGVVTGDDLLTLLEHARANSYAIPAVNCTRYVSCVLLVLVECSSAGF